MNSLPITRFKFLKWSSLPIEVLSFSPDGLWLALGHSNAEIHILSCHTWHIHATIPGDSSSSTRTIHWIKTPLATKETTSLLNYRLITTGLDGKIILWNLRNLKKQYSTESYGGAIFNSKLSPNKDRLAIACDDGAIRVYSIKDDEINLFKSLGKTQGRALSVCWKSEDILFAGNSNSTILRYNLKTGHSDLKLKLDDIQLKKSPKESKNVHIWSLLYLKPTNHIVSGDSTGTVTFWDAETCTQLSSFKENQADILTMATSSNESTVLATGVDSKITMFNLITKTNTWKMMGYKYMHTKDTRSMCISSDNLVASGGLDSAICIFNDLKDITDMTRRPLKLNLIPPSSSQWISVCFPLNLTLYQQRDHLEIWSLKSTDASQNLTNEPFKVATVRLSDSHQIVCSELSPDGQVIAVSNRKGTRIIGLDLQELEIGEIDCPSIRKLSAYSLKFINKDILALCIEDNSNEGSYGSDENFKIILYDIWNLNQVAEFDDLPNPIIRMEVSIGSKWLCTIDSAGKVDIYNLDKMKHYSRLPRFDDNEICTSVAYRPDNNEIAVFGSQKAFYIYDLETKFIKKGNSLDDSIHKIPKHLLDQSDGSISDAVWLTLQSNESSEIIAPSQSYIFCQTPSALCIINLNETYTDNPIAISEDQLSTHPTRKWYDLLNDEGLQLFPKKRCIPKSLERRQKLLKKNFGKKINQDKALTNIDAETDCSPSDKTMACSSPVNSSCNETFVDLSSELSTSILKNTFSRRKFSVHKQFKILLGLKYFSDNLSKPAQDNKTKCINNFYDSSLFLFTIPFKSSKASYIQPFNSKRYGF